MWNEAGWLGVALLGSICLSPLVHGLAYCACAFSHYHGNCRLCLQGRITQAPGRLLISSQSGAVEPLCSPFSGRPVFCFGSSLWSRLWKSVCGFKGGWNSKSSGYIYRTLVKTGPGGLWGTDSTLGLKRSKHRTGSLHRVWLLETSVPPFLTAWSADHASRHFT